MEQESFLVMGPVPVGDDIAATVRELIKRLPVGAHHMVVMVYADGLYNIIGSYVVSLPVTFYPTFGDPELIGKVSIGYGVGNLE